MEKVKLDTYELTAGEDITPSSGSSSPYLDEEKIATIGASNWDAEIKAFDITLKENING